MREAEPPRQRREDSVIQVCRRAQFCIGRARLRGSVGGRANDAIRSCGALDHEQRLPETTLARCEVVDDENIQATEHARVRAVGARNTELVGGGRGASLDVTNHCL
jgi:hypothetical protein